MKVSDLLRTRTEVFSISDSATVHDAARYLRDQKVRAVGVRDPGGALVGIVSQSDISEKVAAENKCPAWMRVSEIMSTDLVTIAPEASLARSAPICSSPTCSRSIEEAGLATHPRVAQTSFFDVCESGLP